MGLTLTPGKVAWVSSTEHAVPVRRKELEQREKHLGTGHRGPQYHTKEEEDGGFIFGDNI